MLVRYARGATDVQNTWNGFINAVVHGRPQFVKRDRDHTVLSFPQLETVLGACLLRP